MKHPRKRSPQFTYQYDLKLVGYARVSTEDQNLDMQVEALKRAGVHPDNIFAEKVSGVAAKRPQLNFALRQCRDGSTLVVWKLDRVGRSLFNLLKLMQTLDAQGVGFKSLQDNIDTTTPVGRMILADMGAIAESERDLIAERTKAGVKRAQERGVRFGQPKKVDEKMEAQMEREIAAGHTIREIAAKHKVSVATVRLRFNRHRLDAIRAKAARKRKR